MAKRPQSERHKKHPQEHHQQATGKELVSDMRATPNRQTPPNPRDNRDEGDNSPSPSQMMRRFVLCLRGFHLNRERPKITDWLVVALTLLVALAAFWSAWIFQGQLDEARRATEIQERPWLKVVVTQPNGLIFVNGEQAVLKLKVSIENVGKSIAKDAQIDVKMFSTVPDIPVALDAANKQRQLCDHPKPNPIGRFDWFPGDEPSETPMDISAPSDPTVVKTIPYPSQNPRRFVGFYVVGCVSYRFSFGRDIHQTFFAYHLMRFIPAENGNPLKLPMMGFEVGVTAPEKEISLMRELYARNDAN